MKTAIVTYSNGLTISTSINGSEETIKKYFSKGKYFNIGTSDDNLQKVVKCKVLPDEKLLEKAKELFAKGFSEEYIDSVLISSKGANTSIDDITHAITHAKNN